jgi:hypothetical protein
VRRDRGNVIAVRTDALVDAAAEDLYPTWNEHRDQWEQTGEAMLQLLGEGMSKWPLTR